MRMWNYEDRAEHSLNRMDEGKLDFFLSWASNGR